MYSIYTAGSQRLSDDSGGSHQTYGALAHQVGSPGGAQAVGQVMKRIPSLVIPVTAWWGQGVIDGITVRVDQP